MALVAKEKVRLGTIRMALAAIKQIEVDTRETLTDDQANGLNQNGEATPWLIAQYEAAGRRAGWRSRRD